MAFIDMTGWKMWEHGVPESRWEVIAPAEEKIRNQKAWICRCTCPDHTIKTICGNELRRGGSKSCGCYRKEFSAASRSKKSEVLGKTFGELTVVEDTLKRSSSGSIIYKCSCSCGNDNYEIPYEELTKKIKKGTTYCSNSIHRIKDLTGQTFGYLDVIEVDKDSLDKNVGVKWLCKCNRCKRDDYVSILGASLTSNKTRTCGCGKSFSAGAEKILHILMENFPGRVITEKCSPGMIDPDTGHSLRFDFFIPDKNIAIEYDGEQHFYCTGYGWNTQDNFLDRKKKDSLKNEYCIDNNISLYRIPYYDIDKVNTLEDILLDKYLINKK